MFQNGFKSKFWSSILEYSYHAICCMNSECYLVILSAYCVGSIEYKYIDLRDFLTNSKLQSLVCYTEVHTKFLVLKTLAATKN